ncbi:MAG: translation elongation factor G [Candidatus Fraserbacteria bacterium RBG_16_55_9]|uniref:Elongation factor G n=1 Tax=Fraserbacteria sp. (strain RBG_16_55_9) TaxID=1817864 RepID=A0A1F5UPF6_FRAXR|nr:MAG: translation elongation factor G [Candidatus Fraserbacteria bacterium RBG_16_55_9]
MADVTTKQKQSIEKLRNIGIVAHIDAGKTTTTERILFFTGMIHETGDVDEGDTQMDWMPQERERGITITAAATLCQWQGYQINLIDTPGHVDFTAEVERSLRVLDGVVTIFSGVDMVESQTEKVWRQADKYNIPRLAFINKIDRPGAQYERTIEMMAERLGTLPLPLQIPAGHGEELKGMIDLLQMKLIVWDQTTKGIKYSYVDIPSEFVELAGRYRAKLLETLAEVDDYVMEKYLNNEEISEAELKKALRRACIEKSCVPVLGGSSLKNVGVQPLLDAVVAYLPSPLDRGQITGMPLDGASPEGNGAQIIRQPTSEEPLTALAFKVVVDEYTGRLVYVRLYSGRLEQGSYVLNSSSGKKERVSRIFHMHANKRQEVEELTAGEIGAIVGPKELSTGDTFCDPEYPILLEKIEFPEPVIFAAVEAKSAAEEEKLTTSLLKLAQEDPTFRMRTDPETNQMIISGMGELHLEIIFDRLLREFNTQAKMGRPQVAYKETIAELVDVEEKFVKQTGGRGQYGHVRIKFEPLARGQGFEFIDDTKGGVIPREYIPAVEDGVLEAMGSGPLAGFPVVDLKATLYYGSFHEVDSSEIAFKTAGARALRTAFHRAKTVLLEPIMEGEIITPTEYIGEVVSDLHTRRGEIRAFDVHGNTQIIRVVIPLAETFGYATVLRSLSQGRATYQFKFSHYDIAPARIKEAVLEGKK